MDEGRIERLEEGEQRLKGIERRLNGTDSSITGLLERMGQLEQSYQYLNDKLNITSVTQNRMDKKLIEFETIKDKKEEESGT